MYGTVDRNKRRRIFILRQVSVPFDHAICDRINRQQTVYASQTTWKQQQQKEQETAASRERWPIVFPSSCLVSNSISSSLFCDGCLLFSMSSMPAEAFDIAASVPALHSQCGHVCWPMQILTNNDTDIGIEPWRSTIRTRLPWAN